MADTTHTVEQDITRIKEDVTSLKLDMAGIKAEMKYFATKADLEAVKGSLCADLEAVKGELSTKIEHLGRTLITWNISSMIALAGIITAIFRFMR